MIDYIYFRVKKIKPLPSQGISYNTFLQGLVLRSYRSHGIYDTGTLVNYWSVFIRQYPYRMYETPYNKRSVFIKHEQEATQGQYCMHSLIGLYSEFSFSQASCHTKAKQSDLSYYFSHYWREISWIHAFSKGANAILNENRFVQHSNLGRRVHFLHR